MITTIKLDGNKIKRCAFCKYWYDPTNQYIQPSIPKYSIWKFDQNAKCKCMKKNITIGGGMKCDWFENKIT